MGSRLRAHRARASTAVRLAPPANRLAPQQRIGSRLNSGSARASGAYRLESQQVAADLTSPGQLDHSLRLRLGHLDHGEPLEDADVANRLTVQMGGGGD